jgi:4-hydroxy-2-oxoheptanedioate aldolase
MPRVNKAIELLEQGQPVYYVGSHTGASLMYETGRDMAGTFADYINIGMEHGSFDMAGLDRFMHGLLDAGPTRSGHRTPAVIVEVPVNGTSEEVVRANAWQFRQILAKGVHGVLLCHAETPEAVRAFVESCRYPFQKLEVGQGLGEGTRGSAGQISAAPVWGISEDEYLDRADPWPLNPSGELLLGLKIENRRALANAELTTRVPGIAFAEWGPGDMAMSFGYKKLMRDPYPAELQEARDRVFAACKSAGLFFLDGAWPESVADKIDEGVMILGAGHARGREAAEMGRKHTKRTMPW